MSRTTKGNGTRTRARKGRSGPKRAKQTTVPIWEDLLKIASSIPEAELHKLPTDLAAHHDHYLYGSRHS